MAFNIEFHIRIGFDVRERFEAWHEQGLIAQRARLELLPGFCAKFDQLDEDLLTDLIIEGASTLEEALEEMRRLGHEIAEEDIVEWRPETDDEGEPGIYLLEARRLRRDSRVEALLAHLRTNPAPGSLRVDCFELNEYADVKVSGSFRDYDTYREYRLPMILAGAAAGATGGSGQVAFIGYEQGEPVALFCGFDSEGVRVEETDLQNVGH
ncbi:hypothetical protein ACFQ78_31840 [Streptomyces sp. NPDC056519]|uniref:hypothetical protein n=1 Tax=Streptomyces sp. NPDC056519 TaxID=3345849 RepID=UPI0036B32135